MLPNWLYGKSKSKLAELLGGGGAPSDYNQVKAQVTQNTEDIASLNDALDTKVALTQITNPNLLDNPWFTVNQRGDTSWSSYTGYKLDRWFLDEGNGSIDDGVFTHSNACYQKWEDSRVNTILGKTVTMSWMLSDGTIGSETATLPGSLTSSYVWLLNNPYVTMALISDGTQIARVTAGTNLRAVKLELGSVSTLAMDTAPDMTLELAKCQRYFYKTLQSDDNGASISPNQCLAVSTTRLQGIKFPVQMRANPIITINKVNELGSSTAITGVTSQWISKEGIAYFSIADATVGNLYIIDFEASAESTEP